MADDGVKVCINLATWGQLLTRLKTAGVGIALTKRSKYPYLRREIDGKILTAALPKDFDPENPDRTGRVGVWVFDSIKERLGLDDSHFSGWYRAFH